MPRNCIFAFATLVLLLGPAFSQEETYVATPSAAGAEPIASLGDLPPAVSRVYERLCAADFWIDGKRKSDGSSVGRFADGTSVYLLNCGDAGSTAPFAIIVTDAAGSASEGQFHWRLRGRNVEESGLSNAHFGTAPDTVVTSSHASATCEPEYVHHWNGASFDLVRLNRAGCKKGE